ncbi:MAG TPA: NUDIX hydrolase [Candidatus Baltobacteraceae bacterium]
MLEREGSVLLVASQYPNQAAPLWHLPGGRPRRGELLSDALAREFVEETGLVIEIERLLYVSESFERIGNVHVVSATFAVRAQGTPQRPMDDAHVVDLAWVARKDVSQRIGTRVIREPLEAYLGGTTRGYHSFAEAGITITFADNP